MSASARKTRAQEVTDELTGPNWEVLLAIANREDLYPSELYDLIMSRKHPTRTFASAAQTFAIAYYIALSGQADPSSPEGIELRNNIEDWLNGDSGEIPELLMQGWI